MLGPWYPMDTLDSANCRAACLFQRSFRLQAQHVESEYWLAANVLAGEVGLTPQAGVHGFNVQSLLRCACRSVIRLRRIEVQCLTARTDRHLPRLGHPLGREVERLG